MSADYRAFLLVGLRARLQGLPTKRLIPAIAGRVCLVDLLFYRQRLLKKAAALSENGVDQPGRHAMVAAIKEPLVQARRPDRLTHRRAKAGVGG